MYLVTLIFANSVCRNNIVNYHGRDRLFFLMSTIFLFFRQELLLLHCVLYVETTTVQVFFLR